MMITLWIIVALSVVLACLAWWRTVRFAHTIKALQRNEYYMDNKLKTLSKEMFDMVAPLRLQLAQVAEGKHVDSGLIRQGKLYHEISMQQAWALCKNETDDAEQQSLFLDVRSPKEYAVKHIAGATLLPMEELESRSQQAIPTAIPRIFVYCSNGDRSRLACDFLSRQGYGNLYHLYDGLQHWEGPTEGNAPVTLVQIQSSRTRSPHPSHKTPMNQ